MASAQKSCSVPKGMGERLEQAAKENDMLESEVIRRALRYYEDANPDGFAAFKETSHGPSVATVDPRTVPTESDEKSGLTVGGVGGVGRGRVPAESDEDDAESDEDGTPYDPTEDMGGEGE